MAGRIPQSFINDLLERTDIVDLIDARVDLKKAGRNYKARCPFHDEKTPSFSVNPEKQFYYCFGCQASGTALTFLMEFDRLEFVEAVETLARLAGVEVPREAERGASVRDDGRLFDVLGKAAGIYRNRLKAAPQAIEYLKGRGLTGVVARDFAIGYAPDAWHTLEEELEDQPGVTRAVLLEAGLLTENDRGRVYDRFRDRIMFPIRDVRGRVIGFGGRLLGEAQGPKYLNSPETPVFKKGQELYGLFEARNALRRIEQLILVEGYMDVVALAQAGVANTVATLGTASTSEHFRKLYRYCDEVVCCFDGDAAGRRAAWKAVENALSTLTDGRQLKVMFLPDGEDPDSLVRREGRDQFLTRVAGATSAIEYLFAELEKGLDLRQLDDQARLASLAAPYLERVPDGVLKELMGNRLARRTGLAPGRAANVSSTPRSRPPPEAVSGRLDALQRRVLAHLLRRPGLLQDVDAELRQRVAARAADETFAEIIKYIDQNPESDRSELLGRWAGQTVAEELGRLTERAVVLPDAAIVAEIAEGLSAHLAHAARGERQRLLSELKAAPSPDKLKALRALQQGSADEDQREPG